jgi:signal peptidase II
MLYAVFEILLVAALISLDLWSKQAAAAYLADKPFREAPLIPGFMDLKYSQNTGASWGILRGQTTTLAVLTAIALSALLIFLVLRWKKDKKLLRLPLLLIFAGGAGNLFDRFAFGYVRDFLRYTFIDFPIFNVADAAITVGSIGLVVYLIVEFIKEAITAKKAKTVANQSAQSEQIAGNQASELPEKDKENDG